MNSYSALFTIDDNHISGSVHSNADDLIEDALEKLMSDSRTASVLTGVAAFGKKVILTTDAVGYHKDPGSAITEVKQATAGWAYDPPGIEDYSIYRINDSVKLVSNGLDDEYAGFIYLSDRPTGINDLSGYSTQIYSNSSSAVTSTYSIDRAIFHEFVHLLTLRDSNYSLSLDHKSATDLFNKSRIQSGGSLVETPQYIEDIAIIGENFLYSAASIQKGWGSDYMRLGHGDSVVSGGVSGMTAFNSFDIDRTITAHGANATSNYVSFKALSSLGLSIDEGDPHPFSLELIYNENGYNPLAHIGGADTSSTAPADTAYDHYLLYRESIPNSSGIAFTLGFSGPIQSAVFADLMTDSMVMTPSSALSDTQRVVQSINSIATITGNNAAAHISSSFGLASFVASHLNSKDVTLTISAERFTDGSRGDVPASDITGPMKAGTQEKAMVIAIDGSNEATGVNIFGAGGYVASNPSGWSYDGVAVTDFINGSSHADTIIAGTGVGIGVKNYLLGRAGQDLLVGRGGNDDIRGGSDNDVLSGGVGYNTIDGGEGLDVVSFAQSSYGISGSVVGAYTTSSPYQLTENDSISHVEGLIATDHADFLTALRGTFVAGMGGDDRISMRDGSIAFGGSGADAFTIEDISLYSRGTPSRFLIGDFASNDSLGYSPSWMTGGLSHMPVYDVYDHADGTIISVFDREMSGGGGTTLPTPSFHLIGEIFLADYHGSVKVNYMPDIYDSMPGYTPTVVYDPSTLFPIFPI
jgi:Ca2+-binding RTX toxin-like protein